MLALLRSLDAADWSRPTDCTGWSVHDVVAHLVGSMDEATNLPRFAWHALAAPRRFPALNLLDALNAAQVGARRAWDAGRLLAEFERLAPRAVRARQHTPALIRRITPPSGFTLPPGMRLGHVFDVIVVRDCWLHRVDIARACGRDVPAAEYDADVVELVIRDLDRGWNGPPIVLELSGAAGGNWRIGEGEPAATVRADAVECCRSLSGRAADLNRDDDTGSRDPRDGSDGGTGSDYSTPAAMLRAARVVF